MSRFVPLVVPAARAAVLCAAFAVFVPNARADVKVVSHVTITGAPTGRGATPMPTDQTLTTYYKGTKTRTETGGSKNAVTLYDAQTGMMTVINNAQKTYTVMSLKALGQNPMMAMLDIKTTANMKPGGKTKIIAGKPCKNYLWQATIAMGVNQAAMPTPTGKNGAAAPSQIPSGPLFTIKMDGEQWTSEAVKLPGGVNGRGMLPAMMTGPARSIPGMAPLVSKLSAMKGLPLSSTITQTFEQSAAMMGMPGGAGAGVPKGPMVTKSEVVSISEAALSDALFTPPAGFRKIEEKMPMMPGGKMGGSGRM